MAIDIVLISGKQGSGKTTTAAALELEARRIGYTWVRRMKFADPLYELHDTILDLMQGWSGEPRPKKDGPLLQWLGTDFGRKKYGDDIWVKALKKKMDEDSLLYNFGELRALYIIDDCRFENEFDAFREALRIRLKAKEDTRKARTDCWREDTNHPSEIGLDFYDNRGLFDLYIDTDILLSSPLHCATLISYELQIKNWIEKRLPWRR